MLTRRVAPHREGRQLAVYCVERYCRAATSQAQLASLFALKPNGFVAARARAETLLRDNPDVYEEY
jgi:hypothetical protein